ncbi:RPS6KC1 [Bugula neritina]|uniref:RPS6KC1 n=1 Tax=Bugula neritina TaxID=10212 RepID=A0A7J7JIC5_BUGNE|nr:RPS6KC1 [Bugula neritina]
MAGSTRKDPWIRWFDVTNPQKHSGGYTVYKVTSKVFPVHSPEITTETIVWKRYKDFNKLHKTLSVLHQNLHRPGVFPGFPKPRLFGRFDDDIIEERRLAALALLNFVSSQAHLFNSLAVQEFFEASEKWDCEKETHGQNILHPVGVVTSTDSNNQGADRRATPEVDTTGALSEGQQVLASSLPDSDTGTVPVDTEPHLSSPVVSHSLSGTWAHRQTEHSDSDVSDKDGVETTSQTPDVDQTQHPSTCDIVGEFDPCTNTVDSWNHGEVSNSQLLSQVVEVDSVVESADPVEFTAPDMSDADLVPPSDTLGEYIESKDDYLYKAVKQISRARKEEKAAHYQIAFDYYKRAVSLLLTGVQGDGDEGRRSVVKRKTAEYLVYAEKLHHRYLDSSGTDGSRWRQLQVPRPVARLRTGLSELSSYKVLGLVGKNMLVLDKSTEETFVIKVLQKNSDVGELSHAKQIIPTKCSRMVKLVKYFETECTIYLLLEYARGMTLWQYIHNYLHSSSQELSPYPLLAYGADNVYSGKKYPSVTDPTPAVDCMTTGTTNHISSNVNVKAHSEECLPALLGFETSSTGNQHSDLQDHHTCADVHAEPGQAEDVFADTISNQPSQKVLSDESLSSSTRRMSLKRSNSSLSRSVSVERTSDIVSSSRHRNLSAAFDDLELSSPQSPTKPHLPENCVQKWAAELLMAIDELHQCGLILHDLRPHNILLSSQGQITLTYFCRWPGVHQELSSKSKENFHVAPEGTLPGALCFASDYWSFGVILYELLTGYSLCDAHPEGITSHTILRSPDHLSQEAEHLLKQLLRCNSNERLGGGVAGIEEIKAHPFFSKRTSDTVSSSRHRNLSAAFDDLELSSPQSPTNPHLPENCVQKWAAELLMAIDELHQCGLILHDLRPHNILLSSQGQITLTYFCRWPGVHQELSSKSKENFHVAPEGTLPGALCFVSDYWSLGVILYELLTGYSLCDAYPEGIISHTFLRSPDHPSQESEYLLKQVSIVYSIICTCILHVKV